MTQTLFDKTTSHKKPKLVFNMGHYGVEHRVMLKSFGCEVKGQVFKSWLCSWSAVGR